MRFWAKKRWHFGQKSCKIGHRPFTTRLVFSLSFILFLSFARLVSSRSISNYSKEVHTFFLSHFSIHICINIVFRDITCLPFRTFIKTCFLLLFLSKFFQLSKPQLNHNSIQPNITLSWVRQENDFANYPTPTNSMSAISQLLLTQFWWNFKRRLLLTSRTDSNCHSDICPGNICPGDNCPY